MKIRYIGLTDKGTEREHNEDSYLAIGTIFTSLDRGGEETETEVKMEEDPLLFVVADGMGGHAGGEVASNMALGLIREKFQSLPGENREDFIRSALLDVHKEVLKKGREIQKPGMGTTATGCIFFKEKLFLFNIGDSRIYRFRDGYISQLTRDHSLREEIRDESIPKNYITSCIGGGSEDIRIDITDFSSKISPGDILFLLSDGITDSLNEDDLEFCLNKKDKNLKETLSEILSLSLEKGSTDNVTGILLQILD